MYVLDAGSKYNLEMLVFEEMRKLGYPGRSLPEQLNHVQGSYWSWKSYKGNFVISICRPSKSWIVIVDHGKSLKIVFMEKTI